MKPNALVLACFLAAAIASAPAPAQPPAQPPMTAAPPAAPGGAVQAAGAEGPAASALNRIFQAGSDWAMYGAPRAARLSREEFDLLASAIEETRFAADKVQIVVIVQGGDAGGAIGLVEKRGRKFSRLFVSPEGPTPFDVWRQVGYQAAPERILGDFRENVLAAEERYRDLPLRFAAQVRRVTRDDQGEVSVEFSIRRTEATLACRPWPGAPQLADPKSLKTGLRLEAAGQFAGYAPDAGLKLRNCLFSPPR